MKVFDENIPVYFNGPQTVQGPNDSVSAALKGSYKCSPCSVLWWFCCM